MGGWCETQFFKLTPVIKSINLAWWRNWWRLVWMEAARRKTITLIRFSCGMKWKNKKRASALIFFYVRSSRELREREKERERVRFRKERESTQWMPQWTTRFSLFPPFHRCCCCCQQHRTTFLAFTPKAALFYSLHPKTRCYFAENMIKYKTQWWHQRKWKVDETEAVEKMYRRSLFGTLFLPRVLSLYVWSMWMEASFMLECVHLHTFGDI